MQRSWRVGEEQGYEIRMLADTPWLPAYFAPSLPAAGNWTTKDQLAQRIREVLRNDGQLRPGTKKEIDARPRDWSTVGWSLRGGRKGQTQQGLPSRERVTT